MKKRKRIGLLFTFFREEWTGGFLYLANVINATNYLSDDEKPIYVVYYNERSEKWMKLIDYPYIEKVFLHNYKNNLITTILSVLTFRNLFVKNIIEENQLDGLFPVNDYLGRINNPRKIRMSAWFPDMQHKFYPQYFGFFNRIFREVRLKIVLWRATDLVQSSYDVLSHLKHFYKVPQHLRLHVLRFVSQIDSFNDDIKSLRKKYQINKPYFIVSNQFFKHKNHLVVFKAISLLKNEYPDFEVLFTGKADDYRNPDYISEIHSIIEKDNLSPYIKMMGLIPREDQLGLMKNALAVIQPSKFEGWSTVVEDAKSLQQQIILSDLAVHLEQMEGLAHFFEPDNTQALKDTMKGMLVGTIPNKPVLNNYEERVAQYAKEFLSIFGW